MDKITKEDINSFLSLKDRIVLKGYNLFKLGPKLIKNIKSKSLRKRVMEKLEKKVTEEEKQDYIDKKTSSKLDKLDSKIEQGNNIANEMWKDEEYIIGGKSWILEAVEEKVEKLKNKKVKVERKKLGVFALSKIYVKKNFTNWMNKRKEAKIARKEEREKEEAIRNTQEDIELIKSAQEEILRIQKEIQDRQDKINESLKKYPELLDLLNDKKENKSDNNTIFLGEKSTTTELQEELYNNLVEGKSEENAKILDEHPEMRFTFNKMAQEFLKNSDTKSNETGKTL